MEFNTIKELRDASAELVRLVIELNEEAPNFKMYKEISDIMLVVMSVREQMKNEILQRDSDGIG